MLKCLSGQSPYQEPYAEVSKSHSKLRGEPQAEKANGEHFPSQCIRYTPRPSRASASIDPAVEPESRPGETLRLCWHDRIGGRRPVPESQTGTKIGLGRRKLRSPLDARAVRILKSDAFRGGGSDGKGFGRRSASGRLQCRRWHLRIGHLPWVRHWPGLEPSVSPNRGASSDCRSSRQS